MGRASMVRIDPEYVERYLERKNISHTDFCRRLGYSEHWWRGVRNKGGCRVKPNVARLICEMYSLDYEKLVVRDEPENKPTEDAVDESVHALVETLFRIETKIDKLLEIWSENN